MKAPLLLVVSKKMDANKKEDRYEDKLIRMGEKARRFLGLGKSKTVELWPEGSDDDRINRSKELQIFKAYSDELKELKDNMSQEDFCRVGFVTSRTFNFVSRDSRKKKSEGWVANTVEDTVIGGDPEFLLINEKGSVKYAKSINGFNKTDELGSDGPWAEVRPKPAIKVENFVKNIKEILCKHPNKKLIDKYQWLGGCFHKGEIIGDPYHSSPRALEIGGHIHIGTPLRLAKQIELLGNQYRDSAYSCLKKVLDEYVSIPAMRIDGMEKAILRRQKYGGFRDIRTNHGRLEYRTLSGEWLTHPDLAKAVVGTVKAVSHAFFKTLDDAGYDKKMIMTLSQQKSIGYSEFYFFDKSFCYWKNIEIMKALNAVKNSSDMIEILDKGKIKFNKTYFNGLKRMMKKLPTYKEYSDYIDYFLEIIELPDDVLKDRSRELKEAWVKGAEFII